MSQLFDTLFSAQKLFILLVTGASQQVFLASRGQVTPVLGLSDLKAPDALQTFAAQNTKTPWAILVDLAEESFWGGAMPKLSGVAKKVWLDKLAQTSGVETPYRWTQVQGKSQSQQDKLRVLGVGLNRAEAVSPWADALQGAGARLKGVYSPIMLTQLLCEKLKIKLPKAGKPKDKNNPAASEISVIVTPHPQGLRQTVLADGYVRFSRLALTQQVFGEQWYQLVQEQTQRLRDYLSSSGQLANENAPLHLYCLVPVRPDFAMAPSSNAGHRNDRYEWIRHAWANHPFVHALATQQPFSQLAPASLRYADQSFEFTRLARLLGAGLMLAGLAFALFVLSDLWQRHSDSDQTLQATQSADKQYTQIAKGFPNTPLTAAQLVQMSEHWEQAEKESKSSFRPMLSAVGQVLSKHSYMQVDEVWWQLYGEDFPIFGSDGVASLPATEVGNPQGAGIAQKVEAPKPSALVVRGWLGDKIASDLRSVRDALSKIEADFNAQPLLRAELTRKPVDLSAKGKLTGDADTNTTADRQFEFKLWQRLDK